MLNVKYLRDNKESVVRLLKIKNINVHDLVDLALDLDDKRKINQQKTELLLSESKKIAKEIGGFFKSGDLDKANNLKEKTTSIKRDIKEFQSKKAEIEKGIYGQILRIKIT